MLRDINADTEDDQIAHLMKAYEAEANAFGFTLNDIEGVMKEYREELRADLEGSG